MLRSLPNISCLHCYDAEFSSPQQAAEVDTNMVVQCSSPYAPVHPARPQSHAELPATVPVPQQVASPAVVRQLCTLGKCIIVF